MQSDWPDGLWDHLHSVLGRDCTVMPLRGQSRHSVWLVRSTHGAKIVKAARRGPEASFYRELLRRSPRLRALAPAMEWSMDFGGASWLVLEWIPNPLPRSRWLADPEVIEALIAVHQTSDVFDDDHRFRPHWANSDTEAILALLPPSEREAIRDVLLLARAYTFSLFLPVSYISGDPNPTNWGVRDDGRLALYDWERFGKANPALDLAITIPGLGRPENYARVASLYATATDTDPEMLARMIGWAKVWSVAEYVGERTRRGLAPLLPDSLKDDVVPWLKSLRA